MTGGREFRLYSQLAAEIRGQGLTEGKMVALEQTVGLCGLDTSTDLEGFILQEKGPPCMLKAHRRSCLPYLTTARAFNSLSP